MESLPQFCFGHGARQVSARAAGLLALCFALAGCSSSADLNAVANRLRADNLKQKQQIDSLQEALHNRDVTIGQLQQHFAMNQPPVQTLPPERLADLFTAARLEIQKQTQWEDLGDGKQGLRVFVRTFGADDEIVPASGTLTVEAFELPPSATAAGQPRRLGMWTFTPKQMKSSWFTGLGLNHFAFSCPCDAPPTSPSVVLRVRLEDALTGMTLEAQMNLKVTVPAASAPAASVPTTAPTTAHAFGTELLAKVMTGSIRFAAARVPSHVPKA